MACWKMYKYEGKPKKAFTKLFCNRFFFNCVIAFLSLYFILFEFECEKQVSYSRDLFQGPFEFLEAFRSLQGILA